MKILYGVQLTGNGHIVRSRGIVEGLKNLGHDVHVLMSGPPKKSWQMAPFEPYDTRHGLTFVSDRGRLSYVKTAKSLRLIRYLRDIWSFDAAGFDLVVTDYEPITARVAQLRGIPSVGVGHLYAFSDRVPIAGGNPLANTIMRQFAPARHRAPLHWHHFDQAILPPSIPPDVPPPKPPVGGKILAYLPFESIDDIRAYLAPFSDWDCHVYWHLDAPEDIGHLHLRPLSREGFMQDLVDCEGVICNAGFSLVSEALHLGKKVLVKPLVMQTEQESNARALEELDLGRSMRRLDANITREFLARPNLTPRNYPDVVGLLVDWIDSGHFDNLADFVGPAWANVPMN